MILLGAALALLAQDATSSAAADPSRDPITVTGRRRSPEEMRAAAVAFVDATGVVQGERPAARWVDPVCPRVLGVERAVATIVETRMRAIGTAAGVRLAALPCRTNIVVSFAPDGGALARTIAVRKPRELREVPLAARATLLNGPAPVRWWYTTEPRDRDGMAGGGDAPPAFGGVGLGGANVPASEDTVFLQHSGTSLVGSQTIRAITSATIVIDVTRATGAPLAAVADYAAMVAFAEVRAGAAPAESVLGLFDRPDGPRAATAADTAFLKALYALPLDRTARRHRSLLTASLAGEQ